MPPTAAMFQAEGELSVSEPAVAPAAAATVVPTLHSVHSKPSLLPSTSSASFMADSSDASGSEPAAASPARFSAMLPSVPSMADSQVIDALSRAASTRVRVMNDDVGVGGGAVAPAQRSFRASLRFAANLVPCAALLALFFGVVMSCGVHDAPGFDVATSGRIKLHGSLLVLFIAGSAALLLSGVNALRLHSMLSLCLFVISQPILSAASTVLGEDHFDFACEYTAWPAVGGVAGYASSARAMGFLCVCLAPAALVLLESERDRKIPPEAAGSTPSSSALRTELAEQRSEAKSKKNVSYAAASELYKAVDAAHQQLEEGLRRAQSKLIEASAADAEAGVDRSDSRTSTEEPEWLKRAYSSMVEHHHHADERRPTVKPFGAKSALDDDESEEDDPEWLSQAIATVKKTGRNARKTVIALFNPQQSGSGRVPEGVEEREKEDEEGEEKEEVKAQPPRRSVLIWSLALLFSWLTITPSIAQNHVTSWAADAIDGLLCLSFSMATLFSAYQRYSYGDTSRSLAFGVLVLCGAILAMVVFYALHSGGDGRAFARGVVTLNILQGAALVGFAACAFAPMSKASISSAKVLPLGMGSALTIPACLLVVLLPWLASAGIARWPPASPFGREESNLATLTGYLCDVPIAAIFVASVVWGLRASWDFLSGAWHLRGAHTTLTVARRSLLLSWALLGASLAIPFEWQPWTHEVSRMVFCVAALAHFGAIFAMGVTFGRPLLRTAYLDFLIALGLVSASLALVCRSTLKLHSSDESGLISSFPWPGSPTDDNLLWLCEAATIVALLNVVPFAQGNPDPPLLEDSSTSDAPGAEGEEDEDSDDDDFSFDLSIRREKLESENLEVDEDDARFMGGRGRRVSVMI